VGRAKTASGFGRQSDGRYARERFILIFLVGALPQRLIGQAARDRSRRAIAIFHNSDLLISHRRQGE
jgi:hypothetical protein